MKIRDLSVFFRFMTLIRFYLNYNFSLFLILIIIKTCDCNRHVASILYETSKYKRNKLNLLLYFKGNLISNIEIAYYGSKNRATYQSMKSWNILKKASGLDIVKISFRLSQWTSMCENCLYTLFSPFPFCFTIIYIHIFFLMYTTHGMHFQTAAFYFVLQLS